MTFTPMHKYIQVQKQTKQAKEEKSMVLLPDDYKPSLEQYVKAKVVKPSLFCTLPASPGDHLVVREAFIEEILIDGKTYYLVLESHVMGILKDEQ